MDKTVLQQFADWLAIRKWKPTMKYQVSVSQRVFVVTIKDDELENNDTERKNWPCGDKACTAQHYLGKCEHINI